MKPRMVALVAKLRGQKLTWGALAERFGYAGAASIYKCYHDAKERQYKFSLPLEMRMQRMATMRANGDSWPSIARDLGYKNGGSAKAAYWHWVWYNNL